MVLCITCNMFHMRQFCRFFYCLEWVDTAEFDCLPYPNKEMYDDAHFADRFRRQLSMFGVIDRSISTPSCSYCIWNRYSQSHRSILPNFLLFVWFDTVEFNRLHVQTTRCTMIWFLMIDFDINWLCLKCVYWQAYLYSLIVILHLK